MSTGRSPLRGPLRASTGGVSPKGAAPGGGESGGGWGAGAEDPALFSRALRQLELLEEGDDISSVGSWIEEGDEVAALPVAREASLSAGPALPRDTLADTLRRLRMRVLPDAATAARLVAEARRQLEEECCALVRLPAPPGRVVIVGDLHGHMNDLLRVVDNHGEPTEVNQYLFNGDFVDRGDWGPEVLFTVLCLRLLHPKLVHLNRGNHECRWVTVRYGFQRQLREAYPDSHTELNELVHCLFYQLPLAHVIGGKVFVVHAGLPLEPVTLDDIAALPRGAVPSPPSAFQQAAGHGPSKADTLFMSLLWSDPSEESGPSRRGCGCNFDESVTKRFLEENGLTHIVRSHQPPPSGFEQEHSGLVSTVFSASNYHGSADNGCVAFVSADLQVIAGESWNEPNKLGQGIGAREEWAGEVAAHDRAAAALRSRVREHEAEYTPQDYALRELRRMVWRARAELLEAFADAFDEESAASGTAPRPDSPVSARQGRGEIPPTRWADVMATVLRTPRGFPWLDLGPHLCTLGDTGKVPYLDFLSRYHNPLSRWLADRWCASMLSDLASRLPTPDKAGEEFDRLDAGRAGRLSYAQLRPLIHGSLPMGAVEARSQAVHTYSLCRRIDPAGTGFVARGDFCAALQTAAEAEHDHGRPERLQESWDDIETAIRVVVESRCDVRALFRATDADRNGFVDRGEFIQSVGSLLAERGGEKTAAALWEAGLQHLADLAEQRGGPPKEMCADGQARKFAPDETTEWHCDNERIFDGDYRVSDCSVCALMIQDDNVEPHWANGVEVVMRIEDFESCLAVTDSECRLDATAPSVILSPRSRAYDGAKTPALPGALSTLPPAAVGDAPAAVAPAPVAPAAAVPVAAADAAGAVGEG